MLMLYLVKNIGTSSVPLPGQLIGILGNMRFLEQPPHLCLPSWLLEESIVDLPILNGPAPDFHLIFCRSICQFIFTMPNWWFMTHQYIAKYKFLLIYWVLLQTQLRMGDTTETIYRHLFST